MDEDMILQMVGIEKRFAGVHALRGAGFKLRRGEVHALVGENGAGKSTLMKVLTGIHSPDAGKVIFDGKEVSFSGPKAAQDAGIAIVHQELNLMSHLSAAQNIFIGREGKGLFLDDRQMNRKAQELFDRLGLGIKPTDKVGSLTVGKQQMVEIAKAISFDASVLILDEPTAALTASETHELFKVMDELKSKGATMVYISHRMDEIFKVSDRITVLRDGEFIMEKKSSEIDLDGIIRAMVGRTLYEEGNSAGTVPLNPEVALEVKGLCSSQVKDVSFQLRKGEILGFAGLMGAGRTETARLIFGVDPRAKGEISKNGKPLRISAPKDAVVNGIGYLSEDRKRYGLATGLSVLENAVMASLSSFTKLGFVDRKSCRAAVSAQAAKLRIKTPSLGQLVRNLSGGNQQKVIIAKWLIRECDVLIFDEPTRGIDVGAKNEIYRLMNQLASEGKSIMMISSELPEILRLSHRVACMREGRLVKILDIKDASQEAIMWHCTQRK